MNVSSLGIFSSLIAFSKLNMRLLSMLISLESLMLSLLVLFYSSVTLMGYSLHFFLGFLVFAACEAALGLSLLVAFLRLRGNDYVPSFSTLNFYV
uniref:NADH-ubiquinone oxidoreductase chain 4L n=1 Tax=Hermissenda emurai TaxID=1840523 RepID=A0A6H0N2Q6_9GAST|nr:NADH dehydrogenase subunit 4L [Hermissenda emurai]QIV24371.1 NADH dehydrogenase subunit 4L [Hermissenda emurai]